MDPILELKGISKRFGNKVVLEDINLKIFSGEILGLIGRSGCGKSTLIKILVGYYQADKGEIIFNGNKIKRDFKEIKKIVGYTTQDNSFYEKLTIQENMYYYANLYNINKTTRKNRIQEILKEIDLYNSKDTLAGRISGGMKRRLDFAISLLHNPKIVILDEPTTGLDPILVEKFWEMVTKISKKEGISILVSSHILSELESYCTSAAYMENGRIKHLIKIDNNTKLEREFKK
ncbi:ABC transporter ATP-binding protein [Candidatus Woesearchaeota archaeon]|nr:ABC transporter ATP-binding protein [Candidatus Woesearchaeota archaeon]